VDTIRSALTLIYTGPSMNRTLAAGDLLHVAPCEISDLRCGDVIVFASRGRSSAIAHRVVSVTKEGVWTRGDNNPDIDPETLHAQDILGKVVAAERNHKIRRIHGGQLGRLVAATMQARRLALAVLVKALRSPYRRAAESGILQALLPRRMRPRLVCFQRPNGAELQLMMGSRSIGMLRAGDQVWTILPPFRLLVDESTLPLWEGPHAGLRSSK
jgi:hypothetical protein